MALTIMQEFRRENYRHMNLLAKKGATLFTGSSLMEGFPINELCVTHGDHSVIYNRGIAGLTTETFLDCIHDVLLDLQPTLVFINIGTNDIGKTEDWEEILERNYRQILRTALACIPDVKIMVMAYYPVNEDVMRMQRKDGDLPRTNAKVDRANQIVSALADEMGLPYINVNHGLEDENGQLKAQLTGDGIHMFASGYEIVYQNIKPYMKGGPVDLPAGEGAAIS